MQNSKIFGEYYTKKVKGFFEHGDLVKVYSHYSLRLFTIGRNEKIFKIHHTDFSTTFFSKQEWRNKKINLLLK